MVEPGFDDPGPPVPRPVSRVRRAFTVAVLLTLVTAMVVLAFVSGRGVVTVPPQEAPSETAVTLATDASRIAVIDADGGLSTTDAVGGSLVRYGDADVDFSFPAWSPDGTRIAVLGQRADEAAVYVFTPPASGATAADPVTVYKSADRPPFYLYWSPDGNALTFLTTEPDGLALRLAPADASAPAAIIRDGAPMYWSWADPTRLLVHSGGQGIAGFFGEVDPDGVATEPAAILAGAFRAPGRLERRTPARIRRGRRRDATADRPRVARPDRLPASRRVRHGRRRVRGGLERPGVPGTGGTRPRRRTAGRSAAPHGRGDGPGADAARRHGPRVLLVTRRQDDRGDRGPGTRRRQGGKRGSDGARLDDVRAGRSRARGEAPALVRQRGEGRHPLAVVVRGLGRLRRPGPPLLRPVRPESPTLVP